MAKRKRVGPSPRTVERLRRRLEEAESTIEAIRDGHVEALVVRAPGGDQIFTLRNADQPYRYMVEQMGEGALTLAADGLVLYSNNRFAQLVGWPLERVMGHNLRAFLEPAACADLEEMLRAATFRGELQLRTADGAVRPVQLSSTALYIENVRTVAVVVSDLTHERTERGLREANRLKDEFLATLSHELRTPLNVVLGWTRMLLTNHLTPAARQHALELIDRNAQAQAQLVNDLVDMSRLTTGKLRLELEALPLVPALEDALESVRPAARIKNLKIDAAFNVHEASVLADPIRLQQVLWNLLSNAVKFTPPGGSIAINAANVPEGVRVEIADSGIGIDPAFLPRVFDRFRQADNGTTREHGGLGLGLAIVRELVQMHGGVVEVRSPGVGLGATFIVTLPAAGVSPSGSLSRPAPATATLSGEQVMLIEDHDDSREVITEVLRMAGASVRAFVDAGQAFEALGESRPTVIVADIGLRGEDGYSLIRRVRTHPSVAIRGIPAIAVTAYASGHDRAAALSAGFQRHVAKPVDPAQLIEAIDATLHRTRRS